MKKMPLLLCLLAIGLVSLCAHADVDPQIGLGDPGCSPGDISLAANGGSFFFTNNASGGGFFTFCNDTAHVITAVDVKLANTPGYNADTNVITCIGHVFLCDITYTPTVVDLFFSLGEELLSVSSASEIQCNPFDGIDVGCQMTVNLNNNLGDAQCVPGGDVPCSGGWPTNPPITFFGQVNGTAILPTVPEPASMLLVSSGFAALWRFRRRRL